MVLGWPTEEFTVELLGTAAATNPGRIEEVRLLGTDRRLKWQQTSAGLRVELPKDYRPSADYAAALKIQL